MTHFVVDSWIGLAGQQAINLALAESIELNAGPLNNSIVIVFSSGLKLTLPINSEPGKNLYDRLRGMGLFGQ